LVADGVSLAIHKRDLEIAYAARRDGQAPRLSETMPFSEYAGLLAAQARSHGENEVEWLSRFEGAIPLVLRYDHHPRDPSPAMRQGAREVRTLDVTLTAGLRDAARREGCTLFAALLGGMLTVAHRLSGQDDLVMGISSAGRPFAGSGALVGNCADVFPIRSRLREPRSAGEYLREVRGLVLDACEHETFSYARLQEKLRGADGPSLPSLPTLIFNLEPGPSGAGTEEAPTFAGLEVERVAMPALYTKYHIGIDAVESRGELHLFCTYDAGRFERATIVRMLEELERALEQFVKGASS
jgi:iturin family lipopeptide synthetase A